MPGCKTIEILLKSEIWVKIKNANAINDDPIKIAKTRLAKLTACVRRNRDPAVRDAKYEIRKANMGAKYHCALTAAELLKRASKVAMTAY